MKKRTNIIYILCDDLGWGDVSCLNPDSKIHTPNIDQLAANGMNFTDAHTGSAVCTPSRYTAITGRYCWRTKLKNGVNGGYSPALITPKRETVASMLKESGYATACIGKWHIGIDWPLKDEFKDHSFIQGLSNEEKKFDYMVDFTKPFKNGPIDLGFDYFYGIAASLDMSPFVFIENDMATNIPTGISPKGQTPEARAREGTCSEGWKHEDVLPALRKKSCEFIRKSAAEKRPFFLYLPLNAPHTPVVPNKEFLGKSQCGIYGDFVIEIDDVVREIVETVADAGESKNTLIIFTSDNGPETLTYNYREVYKHSSTWKFRGMKRDNWEGGHRVPFIASWPATIKPGSLCEEFIELADLMATAADINGITLPDDCAEDSRTILPYLQGNFQTKCREFAIHNSASGKWAIRKGKWKLLLHSGSGGNTQFDHRDDDSPLQLYNMETDKFETNNLYQANPEIVADLKQLCIDCIQNGRSTPGPKLKNDTEGAWSQLQELLNLEW